MPKEWTDEEVQAEISAAVQIVRADKIDSLIRDRLSTKSDSHANPQNPPPPSGGNSDNDNGGNPKPRQRSLWWGDTANK